MESVMKKLLLIAAIGIASLVTAPAKAQVSLSVNIGLQPQWGPRGYNHVDYYYLPDVDCYYDVPTRNYVYLDGGSWVHRSYLPARYRGYDLYRGRKVVINSPNPWLRHSAYRTRYVTNYRGGGYPRGYNRGPRVVNRRDYNRHDFNRGPAHRNNFGPSRGNPGRGNHFDNHGGNRGNDHRPNNGGGRGRGGDNRGGNGRGGDHGRGGQRG